MISQMIFANGDFNMAKLFLVPTPIGNLEDITLRAIRILKEAQVILAEDTRSTSKLLKHYDISTPLQSYHQYNEHVMTPKIIEKIMDGTIVAIVTDAGTPGISDPGYLLVRECIAKGIEVDCLPGATAFVPALVNSGIPCNTFTFEGFLPHTKGRMRKLELLKEEPRTMVFYESPFRLVKTLQQFIDCFGSGRRVSVSREMTKVYEETRRGSLPEVLEHYKSHPPKGEVVIVLEGKND